MFTWIDAKRELARRGQSTKYFCKKFFDVYAACNRQAQKNQENGVDAFYTDENGVLKNGAYNPVFDTSKCIFRIYVTIRHFFDRYQIIIHSELKWTSEQTISKTAYL